MLRRSNWFWFVVSLTLLLKVQPSVQEEDLEDDETPEDDANGKKMGNRAKRVCECLI